MKSGCFLFLAPSNHIRLSDSRDFWIVLLKISSSKLERDLLASRSNWREVFLILEEISSTVYSSILSF